MQKTIWAIVCSALLVCACGGGEGDATQAAENRTTGPPSDSRDRAEEQIAELRAAIEADPTNAENYRELGHALRGLKQRREALEAYKKVVELRPNSTRSHLELALAYSQVAQLNEAEEIYRLLLRAPSVRHIALHNLGNIALRRDRLDEAVAYYEQALAEQPGYMLARYHLGVAQQQQGRYREAYEAFAAVLNTEPPTDPPSLSSYFDALYRMATLDMTMGAPERAAEKLYELLQTYPDHPNAQFAYGRALLALGRTEEAEQALRRHVQTPDRSGGRIGWIGPPPVDDPARGALPEMLFEDTTREAGIEYVNVCGAPPGEKGWITETMGAGAAWLDYDGDGTLDLYLVNGSDYERWPADGEPNQLYRGTGGGRFENVTERAGVGHRGWGYGAAVGDYDNDGDPDLFIANYGPDVLYRNEGDGRFSDVTQSAGVGDERWGASAAFVDIENDGDLDLYVGNYMACDPEKVPRRGESVDCIFKGIDVVCGPLGQVPVQDVLYRNEGEGIFRDVTRPAGVELDEARFALGVVVGDYNNDGFQDIYVANDSTPNSLWKSLGDGTFIDVGLTTLSSVNLDGQTQSGMGTDMGDYNGDGWLDIVVTNFSHDLNTVYRNINGQLFSDDSSFVGMTVTGMALSWGTGFYDFDNDADTDLFIANGHIYPQVDDYDLGTTYRQKNHLFVNLGNGRFEEVGETSGPGFDVTRSFRGSAFADYDDDGDIDVFLTAMDEPPLLLNNKSAPGHYVKIQLEGTRSNRDGQGARVALTAGGRTQVRERLGGGSYLCANDPRLHFGLGESDWVERIEIVWPSGTRDLLTDVAADRLIRVTEGSSPGPG